MLIIAGYELVNPDKRDEVVAAHLDLLRRGRQAPGCLDLAITADPLDPARINNFERWQTREQLEAFRKVADAPDAGVEPTATEVWEYTVAETRPPFG
ncbi:antibiotic biosynthesis monooxygenase [Georgenia halophila]|uniref:Antibiotic biosynthesis monooxygenase n=1 Tax=Georgenia halophila TaxID=620889 RepID=A0ABP8LFA4_9MICO